MTPVDFHSSCVLPYTNEGERRALVAVYDDTYSRTSYRNRLKFIGGFRNKEDRSPLETLQRELEEELHTVPWLLESIRASAFPWRDYLIKIRQGAVERLSSERDTWFIESMYLAELPEKTFDRIQALLTNNEKITDEGNVQIVTPDDLLQRRILGAWGCSRIVGQLWGMDVPDYDHATLTLLGRPQETYTAYREKFPLRD